LEVGVFRAHKLLCEVLVMQDADRMQQFMEAGYPSHEVYESPEV
jgi:hypothetical protein